MRKKTFYLIGSISCLCWIVIVCYLFVHKPPGKIIKLKDVNYQVEQLEKDLKGQLNSNKILINNLRSLKRKLSGTGKEIKSYSYDDTIAVLLFSCNRVTVRRNLDQLLKYRPDATSFPIIVSQDCGHEPTRKVLQSYGDQITLIRHPDLSDIPLVGKEKKFKGYYKIARHYAWALNQTFNVFNYNTVIIVEDDLDIAPDFFEYFRATYQILASDPTLWCVSAWNDNGKEGLIADNSADTLYRSDFFPGLGWMMTKNVWLEIADKWPKAFWDDWIRQPAQRKERACIRPEVSRTKTFGKVGVSNGLFFEKHLKFIKLNEQFVPFTKYNLTYLLKDNYDDWFIKTVYGSPSVTVQDLASGRLDGNGPVRLTYRSKVNFKTIAKAFRLMDDFKSGVPRTGYRGVVPFMFRNRRVYLAPPPDWKGYDTS
ncbi:alpha-1,3-mannosyl-glycoprotein 2-beta-N-acetylglucosaminyltransferase [Tetranychus urticae]|uniref:Alpha-1,3-mannosyl-glycoprotein 2-beta-N-acetylglucosaminyltransferase n=1 Tax=Tetranychus urticae TaxID=32264 RepID=T1KYE9_TETUR|nr:alpha-1,3-mannosyl-glycoprotein 2-beta-N-acetylglucosaminyltransferase [Tetranychus urticae]